jgi:hypothetical protein
MTSSIVLLVGNGDAVYGEPDRSEACNPHPFPNGGLPYNADTPRVAARSAAACSSAGANYCMRSPLSRVRGPAMLITPSAGRSRSRTGAAIVVMPGAKTSSIIA